MYILIHIHILVYLYICLFMYAYVYILQWQPYTYLFTCIYRETGKVMTMGLYIFRHTHANARMAINLNPRSGMPMFACPVVFMRTRFPFLIFTGSVFFAQVGSCWRSWALCWLILSLLGPILSPSCSKMAPRWLNIAQHSAKMSQDSLQEHAQDPKKLKKP